jgi:hypothetical protein
MVIIKKKIIKTPKSWNWVGRRFWESRQFYSAYIALFIAITNWITIQYRLLLENIPGLNYVFSNIFVFMVVAITIFSVSSVLGGHYIHRKRQFRLENALAVEENPYLYRAAPGKEKDLMIPILRLQMDTFEELLRENNSLTEEKKKNFDIFRKELIRLEKGDRISNNILTEK